MDTEMRGNGERKDGRLEEPESVEVKSIPFFEEEFYTEKKKRTVNSLALLLLGIMTTLFCISGAVDVSSYGEGAKRRVELTKFQQLMNDYSSYTAEAAREEVIRYEKNLQRFFIHYDGFNPSAANEISEATDDEISRIKMERQIIYQQAEREIMDKYNPQITEVEDRLNTHRIASIGRVEAYQDGDTVIFSNVYTDTDGLPYALPAEPEVKEIYAEYESLIRERDRLISGLAEKYLLTDEQAMEIIEQSKQENTVYDISNYYEVKAYLEDTGFLRYCLKNARDGEYVTNIPEQEWAGYENPMRFVESETDYFISVQDDCFYVMFNDRQLNDWFKSAGISGYISVAESYDGNNPISVYLNEKNYVRKIYGSFTMAVILACIVSAVIWGLYIKSDKSGVKKATNFVRRIYYKLPFIVKGGLFLAACGTVAFCVSEFEGACYSIYNMGLASALVMFVLCILAATIAILYCLICLSYLWEFIKKPSILLKEPEIRLVGLLLKNVGTVYGQQVTSLSLSMTFLIAAYVLVQLALMFFLMEFRFYMDSLIFIVCEIIINILTIYVFGLITALAKTNKYMDAIISGDFDAEINEKGGYKAVINKLNRVRGGVRRVVVEKNKSDKMKADLITNVSHDLKTPLTSIINYIELLKSPQLTEAARAEYVDVLDRKAQRVKLLIDDLFEATKLSSGQISLEKSVINIVDLLRQAVGELEERFVAAGITLKLTYSRDNISIAADGKKIWRVFENLFTNILKYSQPGTRAYVDVCENGAFAELVFKNISFYEMNFEYGELFERGRRGDASRSTEGSGLGLSIARDIIELHDGVMEILIDGDLFKVEIKLPL